MRLGEDFDRDGMVVCRGVIEPDILTMWQDEWALYYDGVVSKRKVAFNPVAVDGPFPAALNGMRDYPPILDLVEQIHGPDIALYNFRFVVKDALARDEVFAHQDTPYHVGWPNKLSAFVALSESNVCNGGMWFYRGTHQYGYMGDAGELDVDVLPDVSHYCPDLEPGDVVLMHSATWHRSTKHDGKSPDRVLADIIYQPASDPSGRELVRGEWRCEPAYWMHTDVLFKRSRVSRIKELEAAK